MKSDYDLIIIGSGPAGCSAALYAGRAQLRTVVFEEETLGGSIVNAEMVENYAGFPEGIAGSDLSANLLTQVMKHGIEFKLEQISGIEPRNDVYLVRTATDEYSTATVIVAGGARPKKLGIPGEEEFAGKGVFTCVMCDGSRFLNQEVAILGGGDGGVSGGLYMTQIASKITLIERLPSLTAAKVLQERISSNPKVRILCSTEVEAIGAEGDMKSLRLKNIETGKNSEVQVNGVFILVGLEPRTEYLAKLVELDNLGYVMVNHNMETNRPGIFAAGDIRYGSVWQAITAAGDGAIAALSAAKFISLRSE